MEVRSTSVDIGTLKGYMDMLSDLRRSSTLIGVQSGVPEDVDVSKNDPVKCSVCMGEFEDPYVAITTCGHGLHENCMESLKKKHDNGSTNGNILYPCPLCRTKFRKENVIKLIGILPPTGSAAVWRAIQLSAPWKVPSSGAANMSTNSTRMDSLPEKLYISLRALFRHTNELERLFKTVLVLHEEAVHIKSETVQDKRKIMKSLAERESSLEKKWDARMKLLEEREGKLLFTEHQNEMLLGQCMKAAKREEDSHLSLLETLVTQQKELDRTRVDIHRKQEKLDAAMKEMETRRRSHEEAIRSKEERRIASERNSLMLRNQVRSGIDEMRNPAFSDPECEDDGSDNDLEIIDVERLRDSNQTNSERVRTENRSLRTRARHSSSNNGSKRHRAQ